MHILLVDDEVELADPLQRILTNQGYKVDVAHSGDRGLALAQTGVYDLLILDWLMPGLSGVEICQQIRQMGNIIPVLFLTAKDTLDDRVIGLDSGADDYLIKPFELRELLARVRALLRRSTSSSISSASSVASTESPSRIVFNHLELDCQNQLLYRDDQVISLSEKEFQLLEYFMRYPNQLLTHEQIQSYLWSNEDIPASNVLVAQIRLLRRKIDCDLEPSLINTVYGKGYRFG